MIRILTTFTGAKHRRNVVLSPRTVSDYPSQAKCDCDERDTYSYACPLHDPVNYSRLSAHRAR